MYHVYIVQCRDGTLYTGIATDVAARIRVHNTGTTGARYTRIRRPVVLVYVSEPYPDRSTASRREYSIKQLSRTEKLLLCSGFDAV